MSKKRKSIKVSKEFLNYIQATIATWIRVCPMLSSHSILVVGAIVLMCTSCSIRQFIPEGQSLYTGAELEMDTIGPVRDYKKLRYVLEELQYPKPNSRFLGMRSGLFVYYKSRTDSGWIYRFLDRKMGEEPVYLDDVDRESVEELMYNRLENRGHFQSLIYSSVETDEEKKLSSITYRAIVPEAYEMARYQLEGDTLPVHQKIHDYLNVSNVIEEGVRFDLDRLKIERDYIDAYLKSRGYYNFNPDFLEFEADTNQYDQKKYDLFLKIKDDAPTRSLIPYRIQKVNVFSNFTLGMDTTALDTVQVNGKDFISTEMYFRPDKLDPFIQIQKGDLYSAEKSSGTSRRLGSTGAYKFVNIRYDESERSPQDSVGGLVANIYLSPLNKRAVRAQLQVVTKSNNFTGPSLAITYSNRNLFSGGEVLDVTGSAGYETQLRRRNEIGLNSLQLSLETSLVFPRVILPVSINTDWFDYSIPKTRMRLGGEFISRTNLFSMSSVSTAYGFFWSGNRFVSHELYPISITYLNLLKSSTEFDDILERNPFLQSSFDQQFISGMTYSYTYNGMVDQNQKHQIFLNGSFDIAGNLLHLMTAGRSRPPETFLGLEYAQYAKAVFDVHYHINMGRGKTLASRILAGIGEPYGNSNVLPYSRQFYTGGPYSIRAFNTRQLGPGTYTSERDPSDDATYFDRTGNLRLEANVEFRFPVYSYLKGAVFLDAGNVWLTKENVSLPGGRFGSDFLKELGIGAGFGLRLDIQSFVIRVDLASPMHDPGQPAGQRWVLDWDRPVLNLAIGYPF